MFDKTTDVEKRLKEFRTIRRESKTEADVLNYFAEIKTHNRYLDYWTPKDWMAPFDIIENGYFCTTGISILLYNVLSNLKFIDPSKTEWKVISNHVTGKDGAIFISDGYAYNLSPGNKILFVGNEDKYIVLQDLKNIEVPII